MKTKIRSSTKLELHGSFVYFILSKDLVYVGETQKITFSRWVQHFYKNGTFSKKVVKFGSSQINYFERVNLLSVELVEIRNLYPELKWKALTQAVEHSLHKLLLKSPSILINNYFPSYEPEFDNYKIVSDTSKTAPRYLKKNDWDFADRYSENVMNQVIDYLT